MIKGKEQSVRRMLIDLGVPGPLTVMCIPYMFFTPGTSDPDAQGVISIIKAFQASLRKLGHRVSVSGILDGATAGAIDKLSPPTGSFLSKTWMKIGGDIVQALKHPARRAHQLSAMDPTPLSGVLDFLGLSTSAVFVQNGEVCTGMNEDTRNAFRSLQNALNRVLPQGQRIAATGVIDLNTLVAVRNAEELAGQSLPANGCAEIARNVQRIIGVLSDLPAAGSQPAAMVKAAAKAKKKRKVSAPLPAAIAPPAAPAGFDFSKYLPYALLAGGAAVVFANMRKRRA